MYMKKSECDYSMLFLVLGELEIFIIVNRKVWKI